MPESLNLIDPLISQLAENAVFGAVILIVLRWGLSRIDVMTTALQKSFDRSTELLSEEQKTHTSIMTTLGEITATQYRIVEALSRMETRWDSKT